MTKFITSLLITFFLLLHPANVYAQTDTWTNISTNIGINCEADVDVLWDDDNDPSSIKVAAKTVTVATLQGFECIYYNLMRIIIPLAGFAAFILLIVAGFQFMTAAGDPKQTQKAQSTITLTVVGIVVILSIWFIFNLLTQYTNINLLRFIVPGP